MRKIIAIAVAAGIAIVSACSTSPKTQVVQMGDDHLSQHQIMAELAKLDQVERQINSNKGVTGANVAAFLFWLPGLAYTYYDAGEGMKLVEQRRSHLTNLYNRKFAAAEQAPVAAAAPKKQVRRKA